MLLVACSAARGTPQAPDSLLALSRPTGLPLASPTPGEIRLIASETPQLTATQNSATLTPASPAASQAATAAATPQMQMEAASRYVLTATLDYAAHHLAVEERIDYLNAAQVELKEIVLVVEPARYPGAFQLTSLSWDDGARAIYHQKEAQIRLPLRQALPPGGRVGFSLDYELQLPQTSKYTQLRPRPFGYTDLQANLGDWYPFVPPYDPQKGWLAHQDSPFGEYLAYESADFEVNLRLGERQGELVVAASALAELDGEWLRYRLAKARSFAWSASPYYEVATESVVREGREPVRVTSYYFPFYKEAGLRVAQTSAQALVLYERLFGPYPHAALSALQADFVDGMEYDGLYFISKDFYNWYRGTESELLVAIAAHETCHQWWYGLVGNDPALEPWLDEALCTYCERLYYEMVEPGGLDWWRTYRVDFFEPQGKIDLTVYDVQGDAESYRAYRDVVYLNGALFLDELRQQIGDEAFFAFLADYQRRFGYQLASEAGFFETLRRHTTVDLAPLMEKYFRAANW
jgi:hypothetical protein